MPFQVSPGVNVSEIDLSTVVPAVSTTEGAIAGVFKWGPADTRVLVDSEETLAARFGDPKPFANGDLFNVETFFSAANFLAYGNKLYVTRVVDSSAKNAATGGNEVLIKNEDALDGATIPTGADFVARYAGSLGNSLKVSVCTSSEAYSANAGAALTLFNGTSQANTGSDISATVAAGDKLYFGNSSIGFYNLEVSSVDSNNVFFTAPYTGPDATSLAANANGQIGTVERRWGHWDIVRGAPGTSSYVEAKGGASDEVHVVVMDEDGEITGTRKTVLEVFEGVSRATDAKTESGESNYWRDVIERSSNWIYATTETSDIAVDTTAATSAATDVGPAATAAVYNSLSDGADSAAEGSIALGQVTDGYDLYSSAEDVDVSLIIQGKAIGGTHNTGLAKHIRDNICEVRRDCVGFISPDKNDVVDNAGNEMVDVIEFRDDITSSSYLFMDSGYKYQYDKYADKYRYIPLNGDMAGLAVNTDELRDAWFSPAGYNRGGIKNLVKLPFNPKKGERDQLYQSDVNPVVTFPGQGTILFGDKTMLGKPSAFDRINVRRLFIVLEKAIATASKFTLFEFNDAFTRSQFKNLVEPFLRDVQGRRGIVDFRVVCDETNNTPGVIDRNEFVGDIYIKPSRSINFIQLNFVAVRSGVEFSEIVGKF
jgi:hypothetical protein